MLWLSQSSPRDYIVDFRRSDSHSPRFSMVNMCVASRNVMVSENGGYLSSGHHVGSDERARNFDSSSEMSQSVTQRAVVVSGPRRAAFVALLLSTVFWIYSGRITESALSPRRSRTWQRVTVYSSVPVLDPSRLNRVEHDVSSATIVGKTKISPPSNDAGGITTVDSAGSKSRRDAPAGAERPVVPSGSTIRRRTACSGKGGDNTDPSSTTSSQKQNARVDPFSHPWDDVLVGSAVREKLLLDAVLKDPDSRLLANLGICGPKHPKNARSAIARFFCQTEFPLAWRPSGPPPPTEEVENAEEPDVGSSSTSEEVEKDGNDSCNLSARERLARQVWADPASTAPDTSFTHLMQRSLAALGDAGPAYTVLQEKNDIKLLVAWFTALGLSVMPSPESFLKLLNDAEVRELSSQMVKKTPSPAKKRALGKAGKKELETFWEKPPSAVPTPRTRFWCMAQVRDHLHLRFY